MINIFYKKKSIQPFNKSLKIESKKKNSFDKINFENYWNTFKNHLKSQEITKNLIENWKNPNF